MKPVCFALFAIALCSFTACEKQPYSKLEAMTAHGHHHDEHHGDDHGKSSDAKKDDKHGAH